MLRLLQSKLAAVSLQSAPHARAAALTIASAQRRHITVPATLPRMRIGLHNLAPNAGSTKQVKRLGRGGSSGHGGTCGRGHKGQKARSGNGKPRRGFEGGQTPIHMLFPKRGFTNIFKKEYQVLNLDRLQHWVRLGRLDPTQPITMKHLQATRCVNNIKDGVKLLSQGYEHFKTKLTIEVSKASPGAMAAIEAAGGQVTCVYHNTLAMRALLHPEKFDKLPKFALPTNHKVLAWYSDPKNRGYLAPRDKFEPIEIKSREEKESA
ncbi:YmL10 [Tieghemiomyces parasiticus]|uniref:YmL10 n=1 Tax=Tieghemiomyces parasiticus TaxID=78921 RepID=A0A9W8ABS3_9FUNG|nr:YmL10 [Tieghemiomyces parasiticus]KAJ1929080.1 YmL10 [Tieghemiomyces parasiticus]